MAKYQFTIDIPLWLPQDAIDELKTDIKEKLDEIVAKCAQYEVKAKVVAKNVEASEEPEEETEEESEEEEE